jgi:hypothetical protein
MNVRRLDVFFYALSAILDPEWCAVKKVFLRESDLCGDPCSTDGIVRQSQSIYLRLGASGPNN